MNNQNQLLTKIQAYIEIQEFNANPQNKKITLNEVRPKQSKVPKLRDIPRMSDREFRKTVGSFIGGSPKIPTRKHKRDMIVEKAKEVGITSKDKAIIGKILREVRNDMELKGRNIQGKKKQTNVRYW